jgi:uncharacterized protein involved in outer membrane biogenesis
MAGEKTEKKTEAKKLGCLSKLIILLVILVLAVYALTTIFFPAERVKAEIVKRASEALQRNVELDDVSLSIFPTPSLVLEGLRVYNPEDFPGGELVSVERLGCDLKIMPLLSKQFVFSEIAVERPVLRLRKLPDGRTNYLFELNTGEDGIETPMGTKEKVTSGEAALTTFAFDWAEIRHGDLIYIDDSSESSTTLNNFSLETRLHVDQDGKTGHSMGTLELPTISSTFVPNNLPLNVKVTYNAEIDFQHADMILTDTRVEVNGIPFDVEATVRNLMDPSSIFAGIKADGVSLEPLLGYMPPMETLDRDKIRLSGKLDCEIESRIEFETGRTPHLTGSLKFKDLTAGYQTISSRFHFDEMQVDFDADSVSFVTRGGKLSEEDLLLAGTIKNWKDPVYSLRTKGSYDLVGIVPFLDPALGHELTGKAQFDLSISGRQSKWLDTKLGGMAGVYTVYYNNDSLTSPLERLDMIISFQGKKVTVDSLYAEYPGVRLTLTGSLKNGFAHLVEPSKGHKKPYLDFILKAPNVNYDVLLPEEESIAQPVASTTSQPASSATTTEATAPIFLPDIEAGGRIFVDTFVYSEIEFTELSGDIGFKDGIITFTNTKGGLYSGMVGAEGNVDINDMFQPEIKCDFAAREIEANDFMARFANLEGHLFGKFNSRGSLSGRGAEYEDFMRSLNADAGVSMMKGRLVNFKLINKLAGQFGFKTFEEETIRDLKTDVKIRDGVMQIEDLRVISNMGDWIINGTVEFINEKINLRVGLYLSEEYSKDLDMFGGLLMDDNGRVRVNFTIGGTYSKPTISNLSTDNSVVQKKAEDAIKKEAKKLLKDLFKKK